METKKVNENYNNNLKTNNLNFTIKNDTEHLAAIYNNNNNNNNNNSNNDGRCDAATNTRNKKYLNSTTAVMKMFSLTFNFIGILIIAVGNLHRMQAAETFYMIAFGCGSAFTIASAYAHLTRLWAEKYENFNINKFEMIALGFFALMYLNSSVGLLSRDYHGEFGVSSFVGHLSFVFTGYDAYLSYVAMKSSGAVCSV